MVDTLCGPSTALQRFHKHASVDRTLQQDRLTIRQSRPQSFRSQDPNVGILDAEFEAFEANLADPPVSGFEHTGPFPIPGPQHPIFPSTEGGDWAADFQKLHLFGSNARSQHHLRAQTRSVNGDWQNELMGQRQQASPAQEQRPMPFRASWKSNYPINGPMIPISEAHQEDVQSYHRLDIEEFDEPAFEAAFAQVRAEVEFQERTSTMEHVDGAGELSQEDVNRLVEQPESIRIGSDTISYTEKSEVHKVDSDELAKTAGQLLEKFDNEQSPKFKESNFLTLMRRIRDREVHIEGDEFRETLQPLHPGGRFYPEDRSRALKLEILQFGC